MGFKEAMKYAYSSGRVKAMESRLVGKQAMDAIINARDASTMLSLLYETDYRREISEYGGVGIKTEHVDFALSKNLARDVAKLCAIAPKEDKDLVQAIMGKWDLYNIKLALEAKDRSLGYGAIAMYLIDYGRYDAAAIKDVMREANVEGMLGRFMINSPYRAILSSAHEAYQRGRDMNETLASIDKGYYDSLNRVIMKLSYVHKPTARVVRTEIDMVNALTLIRAKKLGLKFQDIQGDLVWGEEADLKGLQQLYDSAPAVEALVAQMKPFDLRSALEVYRRNGQLLSFEIGMRNGIFDASMRLLRHAVLSFGAIVAYMYMKEIEVYTLRIAINSAYYGLSKEDLSRLMIWKA